jgi:hypothetical protein
MPYLFVGLTLASVAIAAAVFPFESAFRFMMLSAILLAVRRRAQLLLSLELALGATMFAATWAGAADWYSVAFGIDKVAHTIVPAAATRSA